MKRKIYALLAQIGIRGKKDLLMLGIMYAVLVLLSIFTYGDEDVPITLPFILALPFIFLAVAFALLGIKLFFAHLFQRLPLVGFVVLCGILLLAWTAAIAFVVTQVNPTEEWEISIPLLIVSIGLPTFLSYHILTYFWDKVRRSRKGMLQFLVIHLLITLPLIAMAYKKYDIVAGLKDSSSFVQYFAVILFVQVAIYGMLSIALCIRSCYGIMFFGK